MKIKTLRNFFTIFYFSNNLSKTYNYEQFQKISIETDYRDGYDHWIDLRAEIILKK